MVINFKAITSLTRTLISSFRTSTVRQGCEKLINPELVTQVRAITRSLNVKESEAKDVLSLYQRYLKNSANPVHIDFSFQNIENQLELFLKSQDSVSSVSSSKDIELLRKFHGLDVLKSLIRDNLKDVSPETKFLLNDLKYYGLDSKSAEIVRKFEENGINLITSKQFREYNLLLNSRWLEKVNQCNLLKPAEINLYGKMDKEWGGFYNFSENKISLNPLMIPIKGLKPIDTAGKEITSKKHLEEIFIHEYFHLLHDKSVGLIKSTQLNNQTLFSYLCKKECPDFKKYISDFVDSSDAYAFNDALGLIEPEFNQLGSIDELRKAINIIRDNADEIFGKEAPTIITLMEKSYKNCEIVAQASREYSIKTPLEFVAECGKDKFLDKKMPPLVEDLLNELECPKFG